MKNKKIKLYKCEQCGKILATKGWVTRHIEKKHPYIPPPQPVTHYKSMPSIISTENRTLLNSLGKLDLGENIEIKTTYIIRAIKETEGSNDLEVWIERVTGNWVKK